MAVTIQQFVNQLSDSGVLPREEILAVSESLSGATTQLAEQLVDTKKLTAYQAKTAVEGRAHTLVIGEYVLLHPIGMGGMGRVFKARHRQMDRIVALKVLPERAADSHHAVSRFSREIKIAASLSHPNIVTAYDAGEISGFQYLVMELIDGRDLKSICIQDGPLPPLQAVRCLLQAARGLSFAHSKGIVHRDVKPSNLMLDSAGTLKILDLGLARLADFTDPDAQGEITSTGQTVGTVDYMAPEQAQSSHRVDARADVYSLGCTLFTLLTGQVPYPRASAVERVLAHRLDPLPSLNAACPGLPPELVHLFEQMVAKSPAERPQEMSEVVERLERVESAMSGQAGLGETRVAPPRPALRSGPSSSSQLSTIQQAVSLSAAPSAPSGWHAWKRGIALVLVLGLVVAGIIVVIRRPDGTVVARVPLPDGGNVQMENEATNSPAPSPALSGDAVRSAARHWLQQGAKLQVLADGKNSRVETVEGLPAKDFAVDMLDFRDNKKMTDADLKQLAQVPTLRALYLGRTRISDAALEHARGLNKLSVLDLFGTDVTDRGLAHLAGLKSLTTVNISQTKITDAGLKQLEQIAGLQQLTVEKTRISPEALAEFRQQLPACKVLQ